MNYDDNGRRKPSVSIWDIDHILYMAGVFSREKTTGKKVSDREIDKILSEKFIPIMQRELNIQKNISDDFSIESSDITVIRTNRQKRGLNSENEQIKKENLHINSQYDINTADTREIKPVKKRKCSSSALISMLSFSCLVLCIMLCIYLMIAES
jgi:hypothetical protein